MLDVARLDAGYGAARVLDSVSLTVARGSFHALIGANGAGKSTLLKAIAGLLRPSQGRIDFDGAPIAGVAPARIVARGLALVPEGRRVFGPLTVRENLQLGAFTRLFRAGLAARDAVGARLDFVLATFPRLKERLAQQAGTLSGGEQQMLAIGRALMSSPSLLLLDEPSMGLAPRVVEQVFDVLRGLQRHGLTVLVAEQNAAVALAYADRGTVIESGRIALDGTAQHLRGDDAVREAYLGV
ncbi:MAG TPA: ABC transporter ATP-binding protein [Caldimonas sp.]|nr:ABC transporter ATP-binding protein [Caldimonas sp.]